jgi:hypothetical protein
VNSRDEDGLIAAAGSWRSQAPRRLVSATGLPQPLHMHLAWPPSPPAVVITYVRWRVYTRGWGDAPTPADWESRLAAAVGDFIIVTVPRENP